MSSLRIAFIVGTLQRGGAEKQCCYMMRALQEMGADVLACLLTRGEPGERFLTDHDIPVEWIGARGRLGRIVELRGHLARFRPHLLQSSHFYTNVYATAVGRWIGTPEIGAIRNTGTLEVGNHRFLGRMLLRAPRHLVANSECGHRNAVRLGRRPDRTYVIPNVIDVEAFDRASEADPGLETEPGAVVATVVANAKPAKRLDVFLQALEIARRETPELRGRIVGEGPLAPALQSQARELDLLDGGVRFLGSREDVPAILRRSHIGVLSSDDEGCPNSVMESMAASLPVVATPAGDVETLVKDGESGAVVPFDRPDRLAAALVSLTRADATRKRMGAAGRRHIEARFALDRLPDYLMRTYEAIGREAGLAELARRLESLNAPGNLTRESR